MLVDFIPRFHVAEEETSDQKANDHFSQSWQLFDHVFHRLLGCRKIEHTSTDLHWMHREWPVSCLIRRDETSLFVFFVA